MFPTSPLSGSITIPREATFWMPKPEDIDEEGIGSLIRGTWLVKDVPVREARQLGQEERRIAEVLGNLAATAEDFDRLAHAVEDGYDPDNPDERYALTSTERTALGDFLSDDETAALDSSKSESRVWSTRLLPCASFRPQAVEGIRVITPGPTSPSYCSLRRSTAQEHCSHSPRPPTADSVSTPPGPNCSPSRAGPYSARWLWRKQCWHPAVPSFSLGNPAVVGPRRDMARNGCSSGCPSCR